MRRALALIPAALGFACLGPVEEGTRSRRDLDEAALRHAAAVRACRDRGASTHVEPTFQVRILPSGQVAQVVPVAGDDAVTSCLGAEIARWRLPELEERAETTLTWAPLGPPHARRARPDDPPPVIAEAPIVLGSLDKSGFGKAIQEVLPEVRACWESALTTRPELAGKLVVKLVLGGDGAVRSATALSSTLDAPVVDDCVVARLQGTRFPSTPGGGVTVVSQPFLFGPGGEALAVAPQPVAPADGPPAELTDRQVFLIVARHKNQLAYCHQREAAKNPELRGQLIVRFTIAPDGSVSSSDIASSTLGSNAVEACVLGRFARMKFPDRPGGVPTPAELTLRFEAEGGQTSLDLDAE